LGQSAKTSKTKVYIILYNKLIKKMKERTMRKIIALFVVISALALTSCQSGTGEATAPAVDSTAVKVDSSECATVDSLAVDSVKEVK
jgi:ABC-type oligopeptide transport system substrate-binding subunit